MKRILFIGGFNTDIEEHRLNFYFAFENFFKMVEDTYTVEFFTYNTRQNLNTVYERLSNSLEHNKYDIILAHSMGCCLFTKWLHEQDTIETMETIETKQINTNKSHNKQTKIVLMMPFICKTFNLQMLSYVPCIQYMLMPKCIVIPNNTLFEEGNCLNDRIIPTLLKQVYQTVVEDFMLPTDLLVETLNKFDNIDIIYATNELVSPIPDAVLKQINNVYMVDGMHMAFMDVKNSSRFFTQLKQLISNKHTNIRIQHTI